MSLEALEFLTAGGSLQLRDQISFRSRVSAFCATCKKTRAVEHEVQGQVEEPAAHCLFCGGYRLYEDRAEYKRDCERPRNPPGWRAWVEYRITKIDYETRTVTYV